MTINMYIATLAWLLLVAGFTLRKHRSRHIPLVLAGIILDLALVLYLQVTRDAIQTAASFSLGPFQQAHIAVSTLAILLYLPVLFFGIQVAKGQEQFREKHKLFALSALFFRTCGFLLMFSMIET